MKTLLQQMTLSIGSAVWLAGLMGTEAHCEAPPVGDVLLYASFDEAVRADVGDGGRVLATRTDHPDEKGEFVFRRGYPPLAFGIANEAGVCGGALKCSDVLPRRGRIFFPAQGNLAYQRGGWGGAVSLWLSTDPNEQLKTPFCDPVQITHKGAHDGGLWIDFPDSKPRDMRLGIFRGLNADEKPLPESDPQAAIVRMADVGFKAGQWHHVVISWDNFDTGQPNASARLYVDGKLIGELKDRELAMRWEIEKAGIYIAVNLIGLLDEFAVFNRSLTAAEVAYLHEHPRYLNDWHGAGLKRASAAAAARFMTLERTTMQLITSRVKAGHPRLESTRGDLIDLAAMGGFEPYAERIVQLLAQLPPAATAPPDAPKFPFDAQAAATYQSQYANWAGLPLQITNRHGVKLQLIPPGMFQIGSPAEEPGRGRDGRDETPCRVTLTQPFYLGVREATVGQFDRFVRATSHTSDGERNDGGHAHDERAVWEHRAGTHWRNPGYAGPFILLNTQPVVHVSHNDALGYCKWLNAEAEFKADSALQYALPTEAQWEWACRGGSGGRFWWGDGEDDTGKRLNVGDKTLQTVHPQWPRAIMPMDDGYAFCAPVGAFQANPFGLHDMLGNVWEFCGTRYGPYPKEPTEDPGDLSDGRGFAVRGGGWSNEPSDARCATRNADPPDFCHSNLGFRVALSLGGDAATGR